MASEPAKGPASYFPSIEKKYGKPIAEWQQIVRDRLPAKHMELVAMLKDEHGMGQGACQCGGGTHDDGEELACSALA